MTESFILHRAILAQSETCFHREYDLAMKNKSLRRIALRAQWKALTRRARRSKNAEVFLNVVAVPGTVRRCMSSKIQGLN